MQISRLIIPLLLAVAGCNVTAPQDETALPPPVTLNTVALDGQVALSWSDESWKAAPDRFGHYVVYSARYDFDQDQCQEPWNIEGTTVGTAFLASQLSNGVPRCFSVAAVTLSGNESVRSPVRAETPRFQARALVWWTRQASPARSGIRFWKDLNQDGNPTRNELARVVSAQEDVDLVLEYHSDGRLYLIPSRSQTDLQVMGDAPVSELAPIGEAPLTGYSRNGIEALAGWAYLFRTVAADGYYRFGAFRVLTITADYILIDWALQTDPGNPMLMREIP